MQLVIYAGNPYVFATHDDAQDLTGLYGAVVIDTTPVAAQVVRVPNGTPLLVDETGRQLVPDPLPPATG
jgi:hypothetical protein